jgi:hypothetical protein
MDLLNCNNVISPNPLPSQKSNCWTVHVPAMQMQFMDEQSDGRR